MTDIDTKALALRVAGKIDADLDDRLNNNFGNAEDVMSRLFVGHMTIAEARALASVLREAAEGPATPDLDAVLNATMNEMCRSGRVAIVTAAEMRAPEPAAVPAGYWLAPVEMTREMENAWKAAFNEQCHRRRGKERDFGCYRREKHSVTAEAFAYKAIQRVAPPPATETTKTEEPRHDDR